MAVSTINAPGDFTRFIQGEIERVEQAVPLFIDEFINILVDETPVRTGFLVGSYFGSWGQPDLAPVGEEDTSGQNSINRVSSAVRTQMGRMGQTFYITNTAPYAAYVEFGTQNFGPRAYVRRAINRASTIQFTIPDRGGPPA